MTMNYGKFPVGRFHGCGVSSSTISPNRAWLISSFDFSSNSRLDLVLIFFDEMCLRRALTGYETFDGSLPIHYARGSDQLGALPRELG